MGRRKPPVRVPPDNSVEEHSSGQKGWAHSSKENRQKKEIKITPFS